MSSRYIPTIGNPKWDISSLNEDQKYNIKNRLVIGVIDNEKDYQKVISYMYKKFPFEMDGLKTPETGKNNVAIQWKFSTAKNKFAVLNNVTNKLQDMYAFIVYDKERDMEPVCFSGSYFKLLTAFEDSKNDLNKKYLLNINGEKDNENGKYQVYGNGYVLFIDPYYRRLGLGTDMWWNEAHLYQKILNIRFQKEIQNEFSLKTTQNMFSSPDKCIITSPGRLKNDGTRCQIRVLLDYEDEYLEDRYKELPIGLKEYLEPDWSFLKREKFTEEELLKPWS